MLEKLRRIVFDKQKVPYYVSQIGDIKTATVLDKEGLRVYILERGEMILKTLNPWSDLTEEDCAIFVEKIGLDRINNSLKRMK